MKQKTKLIVTIMGMCLIAVIGVFGIFAIKNLTITMSGTLNYQGYGVEASVSNGVFKTTAGQEYTGLITTTDKMQGFSMDNNENNETSAFSTQLNSWSGLNLVPDERGDITLEFSITNNMSQTVLVVEIETARFTGPNSTTPSNCKIKIAPNFVEIPCGESQNFTIKFDIIDEELPAQGLSFSIVTLLRKATPGLFKESYYLQSSTNYSSLKYYFIEMGTYNGNPVKWRYLSEDGITPYDLSKGMPTSYSGYYMMVTNIENGMEFCGRKGSYNIKHTEEGLTNIYWSDYATSDVRKYLNNDILRSIGIDESNEFYSQIEPRLVSDMYKDIYYQNSEIPTNHQSTFATSLPDLLAEQDKLWVPSFAEIGNMYGGGTVDTKAQISISYWTRTISSSDVERVYTIINYSGSGYTAYATSNPYGSSYYSLMNVQPFFKIA